MKKQLRAFILITFAICIRAQVRYLDNVFSRADIQKTQDMMYGQNDYFIDYPPADLNCVAISLVWFLAPGMYLVLTNSELSVSENKPSTGYTLYPNPYTKNITIQVDPGNLINRLLVMDIVGRVLFRINDIDNVQYVPDVPGRQGLTAGTYLIEINTLQGNITHRVMVR